MKKLTFILLAVLSLSASIYSADVAVNGKLVTWAGMDTNATDFDSDGSDSVGYLYVNGEINTSVSLSNNVKVYLELELNDKVSNGASMNSATNKTVEIDEANIEISEFLMDSLTVKIGGQYLYYSLRDNDKTMLFYDNITGFKGTFKFEKGFLDVFYGKYIETLSSVNTSEDQDAYGLHFEWNFSENIHTIYYANNITFDNASADHGNIITIGAGVDYFLIDKKLELFLEIAAQFGTLSETVDQSGLGMDAGVRYDFGALGSMKALMVELNFGYRSGEDNDTDSSAFYNGMSATTGALIAEYNASDDAPMYKGYANDSYMAVRGKVGMGWSDNISSEFMVAYFDNTDEDADPYGIEIDLSSSYKYSEAVSMTIAVAVFLPDENMIINDVDSSGSPIDRPVGDDLMFAISLQTCVCF